jgi:hypothetical protein
LNDRAEVGQGPSGATRALGLRYVNQTYRETRKEPWEVGGYELPMCTFITEDVHVRREQVAEVRYHDQHHNLVEHWINPDRGFWYTSRRDATFVSSTWGPCENPLDGLF